MRTAVAVPNVALAVSLSDFPNRDQSSELAEQAETVLEFAVVEAGQFVIQKRDRHDYGTDFQLEAKHPNGMTNFRVHVQLRGTGKAINKDGTISISVARTNLNYMLSQSNSIYVCYHAPTHALLVRSADDVFRDAEHDGEGWRIQDTLTIRFRAPFSAEFQSDLRAKVVATSSTPRDDRLNWVMTPPEKFPEEIVINVPTIVVPESPLSAVAIVRRIHQGCSIQCICGVYKKESRPAI